MEDHKFQNIDGVQYSYSSDWIYRLESEEHWRLYWHQQKLMREHLSEEDSILEIGPGTGFTSNYLRSKGYEVTTIDIDEEKNADITANIVSYDFEQTYDFICAFEVLEHIPFAEVVKLIQKTPDICRKGFFLSLPRSEWVLLRADVKIPLMGRKHIELTVPRKRILEHNHFWEIGKAGVSLNQLDEVFGENGFILERRFKKFSRYFMMYRPRCDQPI